MSQSNESETSNVGRDFGPRPELQEGVKTVPGNSSSPPSLQQAYFAQLRSNHLQEQQQPPQTHFQSQQQQQPPPPPPPPSSGNFVGSRPVFRRVDSRNALPFRPPGQPVPNQPQFQPQQSDLIKSSQVQHRPPPPSNYFNQRPVSAAPGPRFPGPNFQQRPQYDRQNSVEGFRRPVTEGPVRFQRPPFVGSRPPNIIPQKSLPQTANPPFTQMESVIEQGYRKSYTLDNPVTGEEMLQTKFQDVTARKNSIDSAPIHSGKPDKWDSTGLKQANEKDIDTTEINGKSFSQDLPDRPESRTSYVSRDEILHSSMHKIDEDDDDAVIIPTRAASSVRKSSILSNEDILQKQSFSPDIYKHPLNQSQDSINHPPIKNLTNPLNSDFQKTTTELENISTTPVSELKSLYEPIKKPTTLNTQEKTNPADINIQSLKTEISEINKNNPKLISPTTIKATALKENDKKKGISPRTEIKSTYNYRRPQSSRFKKSEGDNDSGVDESTQGNDRSLNGDQATPKKTLNKMLNSKTSSDKCKTPIKMLQSPKSPDSLNNVPPSSEKKKVPMNKIQVGSAPSPNIKTVKSKIGSLDNTSYKPGGGKIKLENRKIDLTKVQSRIAAKNDSYSPGGGDKKSRTMSATPRATSAEIRANKMVEIQQQKLQWNAKSKIGSLDNTTYKPTGGEKKIETVKLDFKEKAKSKIGSKDNIKHVAGGGDVKSVEEELQSAIENRKVEVSAQSKIGSLDNVKHKPGGGDVKIFDDKVYLKQMSSGNQSVHSGSQQSDSFEPPTTLNVNSCAEKRRVRYSDLEGPASLCVDNFQPKSIDYQERPMSACSNFAKRKLKLKRSLSIEERPRWRY